MKKIISIILAMILVGGMMGCETTSEESAAGNSSITESSSAAESRESEEEGFSYPVPPAEDGSRVTLSINKEDFLPEDVPDYTTIDGKSYYYWNALEEATGIHLDFIGSVSDPLATSESTMLLITSGEYPDIWRVNWITHPGGPAGALEDELIINLSEHEQNMPNMLAYMEENPDIQRLVVNDDGEYYCFPFIQDCVGMGNVGTGPVIRADWLEEQNLEVPETIDEWTNALRTFKDVYGCTSGLTFEARWLWLEYASSALTSAWGVTFPFYIMDGTVKFGPMEEGYRQFVQQMADWYAEGLLDPDFATVDKSTVQAKFANGESGFAIQQIGNIETCIAANEGTSFQAVPVQTAVLQEGDPRLFGHFTSKYDGSFAHSVSPGDKQDLAMRWCDYLFSQEGQYLTAYGQEGITYTVDENGEFAGFTDFILHNTEIEEEPRDILAGFTYNAHWAFPQQGARLFRTDYHNEAVKIWSDNEMDTHFYPAVTHTTEEADLITNKYIDIETFAQENIMRFILGTQSMDDWDGFVAQMESLGIDEVLAAKQAAYDRYLAR